MKRDLHPIFAAMAQNSAEDMRRYVQAAMIKDTQQTLESFAKNIVPEPDWQKFQEGMRNAYFLLGAGYLDTQIVEELRLNDIETLHSYMLGQAKPSTPPGAAALCGDMSALLSNVASGLFTEAYFAKAKRSAGEPSASPA